MDIGAVIIGDELLSGKRQDKHLPFLIRALAERGMALSWVRMVGDEENLLTQTFRETFASGALVFSFGGIGATPDDLTRACAAAATGLPLVRHAEAVAIIEQRFGTDAWPQRVRMADLPQGARLIPNPVNQVPGFSLHDHHFVPGFPNMAWPMLEWVLDTQYRALFDSTPPIEHRMLLLDTLESDLIPTMEELLQRFPGVRLASLPSTENRRQIDLGIKGRKEAADAAWAWLLERLREQHRSWRPIEPGA